MKLSVQIRQKHKTPYQTIAEKSGVSVDYVKMIAYGARKPTKKKGLEVLTALQKLVQ
jgi:uncharacterized protein YdbL (DUF1318 family)